MNKNTDEITGEEIDRKDVFTPQVSDKEVQLRSGIALRVSGEDDVGMTKSVAVAINAGNNVEMAQSRSQVAVAGRDIKFTNSSARMAVVGNNILLENSSAGVVKAGGNVDLNNSHVRFLAGNQVTAQKSLIGLVLCRQANLEKGSQVLINTPQAVTLGASLGAAYAIIRWLLRRKKRLSKAR
jgi:hypothetical protein